MTGSEIQGRYRILRRLGGGAMGEVFLAEHLVLRRHEALKVLRTFGARTQEIAARFRREARALNRVAHPNIVTVHDFGQLDDGRFYLSMEFAEGRSLDVIPQEKGRLPLLRALHVLAKIADAIGHAHSHGVIHRDLKPSNVVLASTPESFEEPKVLDFGFAKIVSPDYSDSVGGTAGQALGTPHFMAPELVANERFDARVDIYSLGCLAFDLLTGRPPFVGPLMEVCQAHLTEEPPRLREQASGRNIPPEVDELVHACLQKRPDERVQSAFHVAQAFRLAAQALTPRGQKNPVSFELLDTLKTPRDHVRGGAEDQEFEAGTTVKQPARPLDFGTTLAEIARLILDQGCDDVRLVIAYSRLMEAESSVRRYEVELEGVAWRKRVIEHHWRERDGSLRFALGEMHFARSRRDYLAGAGSEIDEATAALQRRLDFVRHEAEKELAGAARAEEEATSLLYRARENLRKQRLDLYGLVECLIPYYQTVAVVSNLWRQLRKTLGHGAPTA